MRYAQIRKMDISNGTNIGIAIFTQGCRGGADGVKCPNCFNTSAWDFNGGKEWTQDTKNKVLELANKDYISRCTILGGEPLEPENYDDLLDLITSFKKLYPNKDIWIYSGYTFEQINNDSKKKAIIDICDVLVDGKYIDELRDMSLKYRGSSNQRIWRKINGIWEIL